MFCSVSVLVWRAVPCRVGVAVHYGCVLMCSGVLCGVAVVLCGYVLCVVVFGMLCICLVWV